jgi:hypothetical protein
MSPLNAIGPPSLAVVAALSAAPPRAALAWLPHPGDLRGRAKPASLSVGHRIQQGPMPRTLFAGGAARPEPGGRAALKPVAAAQREPEPDFSRLEQDVALKILFEVATMLIHVDSPVAPAPQGALYKNRLNLADPHSLLDKALTYPAVLDAPAQARLKVTIQDGRLHDAEGRLVDTRSARSMPGEAPLRARYVMDEAGSIYLSNDRRLAACDPVAAAGEIRVEDGVVKEVSRESALYRPDEQHLDAFVHALVSGGVPPTFRVDPQAGYRIHSMTDQTFESWQLQAALREVLASGKARAAPEGARYPQVIEVSNPVYLHDLPDDAPYGPAMMLTADEKARCRLTIRDGLLHGADGRPFDSSGAVANQAGEAGCARYVMDHDGTLYASDQAHLMLPDPVAAAGEIRVQQGRVLMVNKNCPVYEPGEAQLDAMVHRLVSQGVALPSFAVEGGLLMSRADLLLREFQFESRLGEIINQQALDQMAAQAARRLAERAVPAAPPDAAYRKVVDIRHPEKILGGPPIPAVRLDGGHLQDTRATLVNGRVCTASGRPWDTRAATSAPGSPANRARYVMDHAGNIHISNHARLIALDPVAAAGEIAIVDGVIQAVSRRDDVYAPDKAHLDQFLHRLRTQGVPPGFKIDG